MPTPSKGPRLGGGPAHERLLLNNMAGQLFEHKRITTTVTKAKRLRPVAERMITFAKRGDLASRRRVLRRLSDQGIVHVLFTEIAPAVANREGGYTRITKIGPRKGDKAPMAVVELVLEPLSPKQATVAEAEAATTRSAKDQAAAEPAAAEPEATEPAATESEATEPEATESEEASADESAESKFGPDSVVADEDGGGAPDGWSVKGNAGSMKYHSPDFPSYDSTVAEYWFKDEAAAEAAGFARPGNAPAEDDA